MALEDPAFVWSSHYRISDLKPQAALEFFGKTTKRVFVAEPALARDISGPSMRLPQGPQTGRLVAFAESASKRMCEPEVPPAL